MTALEKIQTDLATITDVQITLAANGFRPMEKGETILAMVTSIPIQRLLALSFSYFSQSKELTHQGLFNTSDRAAKELLAQQSIYFAGLSEVVRSMALLDIKEEHPQAKFKAIGLREDFTVVEILNEKEEPRTETFALPIINLIEVLQDIMKSRIESEPEEEKPKSKTKPH